MSKKNATFIQTRQPLLQTVDMIMSITKKDGVRYIV